MNASALDTIYHILGSEIVYLLQDAIKRPWADKAHLTLAEILLCKGIVKMFACLGSCVVIMKIRSSDLKELKKELRDFGKGFKGMKCLVC